MRLDPDVYYLPAHCQSLTDEQRSKVSKNFSRASIAQSLECLPGLTCEAVARMINPSLELHQCLLTRMWMRMAQLLCWPPRGQQVSHQRWIWGFCCSTKHVSKGIHPGFETKGRCRQKSKTGTPADPQQGLRSYKHFFEKVCKDLEIWWLLSSGTILVGIRLMRRKFWRRWRSMTMKL